MKFEWDTEKAHANERKHGVSFDEAMTAFADTFSQTFYDAEHSDDEHRYATIGSTAGGRLLIVWHTDRGGHIRIIFARKTARSETKACIDARQ